MKHSRLASAILLLLCFSTNAQTVLPDDGQVKDGLYVSSYFSFAYRYPKDWTAHEEAINERIRKRAKDEAANSGTSSEMKNIYLLFTVSRHARGTPGTGLNPTILIIAEKIGDGPGKFDGKDYLLSLRPAQIEGGAKTLLKEPVEFGVNGFRFFRDDYDAELQGVSMRKALFAVVMKGYAVAFSLAGEDQKTLDEMVESMKTILPVGTGPGLAPTATPQRKPD